MKTSNRASALVLAASAGLGLAAPTALGQSQFQRLESPTSVSSRAVEVVHDDNRGGTARTGTPVVAVRSGEVLETGNDGGRGNYLNLYDPRMKATYVYMHMNRPPTVGAGDRVRSGQRIGEVGCTGSCFGDHLHFEIRAGRGIAGAARDPRPLLERWAVADHIPATLAAGAN